MLYCRIVNGMSDMRKTPSYLKGLAETRARVSADVRRYQQLYEEIGEALEKAKAELTSCDLLIRKYDERLNPALIEPIKAWKGRYGARGALKAAIVRILKGCYPNAVSTTEITTRLQMEFSLDFLCKAERTHWQHDTVGKQLKMLVSEGLVERLNNLAVKTGRTGSWRWKGEGCKSLGDLAALAESSGVATYSSAKNYEHEALDEDELPV